MSKRRNRNRRNNPDVGKSLPPTMRGNLAGGVRDMSAVLAQQQLQTLGEQAALPRDVFPYQFGPGVPLFPAPLDPVRPDSGRAEPRIYEYPVAWNVPGAETRLVPWQVLRRAANTALLRDCIRIRKNEVVGLDWDIVISQRAVETAQREKPDAARADVERDLRDRLSPEIDRCAEFWRMPDKSNGYTFEQWITQALEEHLVLDALAIYPRYTFGGDLFSLEVLDGSTIKPLLNERGGRPLPPYPAFQQILYGFPRGEFTADTTAGADGAPVIDSGYQSDQLIYQRREVRTFSPYGMSAVEQSLTDLDLWLKRMAWMRAEYTDGVMPAGWMKNNGESSWTPQQLASYEREFNDYYGGLTEQRQRFRILPPGIELAEGRQGADERYKPDYDLHLLKLVVAHFDLTIAELGFTEAKGLGSSGYHEGQENVQERKGTRPDLKWFSTVLTDISRTHLNMPAELEFRWLGLDDEDQTAADELNRNRYQGGGLTLNEWRDEMGRPRYNFPEADMPQIVTQRGVVFLEGASELAPPGELVQPMQAPPAKDNPEGAAAQPGGEPVEGSDDGQPGAAERPPAPQPKPSDASQDLDESRQEETDDAAKKAELAAYRKFVAKGTRSRPFRWQHHTAAEVAQLTKAGGSGPKARTGQTWAGWTKDQAVSAFWTVRLSQAFGGIDTAALAEAWAADRGIGKTTAPEQPNAAQIADALIWLSARAASGGPDIAAQIRAELEHIIDGVWTDGYYVGDRASVWTAREAIMAAAQRTGETLPAEAAGHATVTASVDWGAWTPGDTDAARRVLGGGLQQLLDQAHVTINSIVPHRMDDLAEVLAEGLEAGLAPDTIARNLDDVLTDPAWASMVAETETARAISAATQDRYLGIGVTANTWMTAEDQRVCPACRDNESAGAVSIGQSFPSGDSGPPGHPRCRCALAPVVDSIANIFWPTLDPTGVPA